MARKRIAICPKCGERPKREGQGYCQVCNNITRSANKKVALKKLDCVKGDGPLIAKSDCIRLVSDECRACPHVNDESLAIAADLLSIEEEESDKYSPASYMGSAAYLDDAGF
jgi:hypothetical protein